MNLLIWRERLRDLELELKVLVERDIFSQYTCSTILSVSSLITWWTWNGWSPSIPLNFGMLHLSNFLSFVIEALHVWVQLCMQMSTLVSADVCRCCSCLARTGSTHESSRRPLRATRTSTTLRFSSPFTTSCLLAESFLATMPQYM